MCTTDHCSPAGPRSPRPPLTQEGPVITAQLRGVQAPGTGAGEKPLLSHQRPPETFGKSHYCYLQQDEVFLVPSGSEVRERVLRKRDEEYRQVLSWTDRQLEDKEGFEEV